LNIKKVRNLFNGRVQRKGSRGFGVGLKSGSFYFIWRVIRGLSKGMASGVTTIQDPLEGRGVSDVFLLIKTSTVPEVLKKIVTLVTYL